MDFTRDERILALVPWPTRDRPLTWRSSGRPRTPCDRRPDRSRPSSSRQLISRQMPSASWAGRSEIENSTEFARGRMGVVPPRRGDEHIAGTPGELLVARSGSRPRPRRKRKSCRRSRDNVHRQIPAAAAQVAPPWSASPSRRSPDWHSAPGRHGADRSRRPCACAPGSAACAHRCSSPPGSLARGSVGAVGQHAGGEEGDRIAVGIATTGWLSSSRCSANIGFEKIDGRQVEHVEPDHRPVGGVAVVMGRPVGGQHEIAAATCRCARPRPTYRRPRRRR